MGRFLKKILVLVALLLLAAVVLDVLFTMVFQKGRTVKAQWLHNMHGRHYDLVITGSSRAWWNIDMNRINERCSINSINLATNHFRPAEILLGLKVFLANGNTADKLLLQLDHRKSEDGDQVFSSTVYDHLPWLKDELVYDHLASRSQEFVPLRHIPFARYARYNFKWGPEEVLITLAGKRRTLFDSTGSFFIDRGFHGHPEMHLKEVDVAWNDDLAQVFALCRDHGIDVEVFMAPYYRMHVPSGTMERFVQLMARYGVRFHDHSGLFDDRRYFEDNWHLGREGGRVYTDHLIGELVCPLRNDRGTGVVPPGTDSGGRPVP